MKEHRRHIENLKKLGYDFKPNKIYTKLVFINKGQIVETILRNNNYAILVWKRNQIKHLYPKDTLKIV